MTGDDDTDIPRPLAGIRVLDLTHAVAGPYVTTLFGDLGAEVIKVEPLSGDIMRDMDEHLPGGRSAYFHGVNRSKRSLAMDLKAPEARPIFERLVERSDVVIHNMRPAAAAKLGVTYEALAAIQPSVILCAIAAFSAGDRRAQLPGMDLIAQALSGFMDLTGEPDGQPLKVGPPVADFITSYLASFAVAAALLERHRTGVGRQIDISLVDACLASVANYATDSMTAGKALTRQGGGHAQMVPYQVFEASDGYFVLAAHNDEMWRHTCKAFDRPDLLADPRYTKNAGRLQHRAELCADLAAMFSRLTRDECVERLVAADVPTSPVNTLPEAFRDARLQDESMIVALEGPVVGEYETVADPIRFDGRRPTPTSAAPELGENTLEILAAIGVDPQTQARLLDAGIVVQHG